MRLRCLWEGHIPMRAPIFRAHGKTGIAMSYLPGDKVVCARCFKVLKRGGRVRLGLQHYWLCLIFPKYRRAWRRYWRP